MIDYISILVIIALAKWMKYEWLSPQLNSVVNTAQAFMCKEQKYYSQSAHMSEIRAMTELAYKEARDFIRDRVAPAEPKNDGKQTPTKGHPTFIAQHATATCCRSCLEKWYHIPKGRELTKEEIDFVISLLMEWIKRECQK